MIEYNENFFDELIDLIEYGDLEDEIRNHNLSIEVFDCELEPVEVIDANYIADSVSDDRLSQDGDERLKIIKACNESIDFKKLNDLMPKLWYPKNKRTVSNAELLEALNDL